jgi:hypothetical protein
MFMNTMAVGPLEPAAFCATGATVALPRRHCTAKAGVVEVARFTARVRGARRAIRKRGETAKDTGIGRVRLCEGEDTQRRLGYVNLDLYKGQ